MLRRKDGSLFWGVLTGRAIDPSQPQEGSIWVYADISEQRQAEEESQNLLQAVEQSPVAIVITNRNAEIEYVNPSFTRVTGYTRLEAIGQNPRILKSGLVSLENLQDAVAKHCSRARSGTAFSTTGARMANCSGKGPRLPRYSAITAR
jgi:PAS domain-containing protein